jgi:hypothetical protein
MITPGGLIPKSKVHAVPDGARIHHTPTQIQIIGADGTILHTAPITKGDSRKIDITPTGRTDVVLIQSGYVAYTYWKNNQAKEVTNFSTVWPVPSKPTTYHAQLLYWFNGLVPNSFDAILQPVLQYGISPAGGGDYYAVASWFVVAGSAYWSSLTRVSVGQQLTGVITLTKHFNTGTYHWNSAFTGIPLSSLDISTEEVLDWAYEALEIYRTQVKTDLPAGKTPMTAINISNGGQHAPSIGWTAVSDAADNVHMAVISTSSTNGALQITYPQ